MNVGITPLILNLRPRDGGEWPASNPDDLLPIPTEYKARWSPEMVTTFWRREKSLTGSRKATPQFRNPLYKPKISFVNRFLIHHWQMFYITIQVSNL